MGRFLRLASSQIERAHASSIMAASSRKLACDADLFAFRLNGFARRATISLGLPSRVATTCSRASAADSGLLIGFGRPESRPLGRLALADSPLLWEPLELEAILARVDPWLSPTNSTDRNSNDRFVGAQFVGPSASSSSSQWTPPLLAIDQAQLALRPL